MTKLKKIIFLLFLIGEFSSCSFDKIEKEKNLLPIDYDHANLSIIYASGDSSSHVTRNIKLPVTESNGSTISWTSTTSDTISSEGKVTRPASDEENQSVILTATLKLESQSRSKKFEVQVVKKPNALEYGPFDWDSTVTSGNHDYFNVENTEVISNSVLAGKTIYFLGSSVTLGSNSGYESFADFIAKRNNCRCIKETVSGTCLRNINNSSYIYRMQNSTVFDYTAKIDGFVVQLSTNDRSSLPSSLGEATGEDVRDLESFNQRTIYGAIEYIAAYIKETWDCPVFFYTGSRFRESIYNNSQSDNYGMMVEALNKISGKWNITVIDMYSDTEFDTVVDDNIYSFIMSDSIHPQKAGYKLWWTPYIEYHLYDILGNGN